jgi:putative transposase
VVSYLLDKQKEEDTTMQESSRRRKTEQAGTAQVRPDITFECLEELVRGKVQEFIQQILEEEVVELLGRGKSERKQLDAVPGYRNGYGKPRKLTTKCGTITLRRPRQRGLEERFESRVLPLFVKRTNEVAGTLPELYLHGLAAGDFDLALRGLLGEEAALSEGTIARLKAKWQEERKEWNRRRLDELEVVYLWVDGVYVRAGLEKDKAAVLVAIAALRDGSKVLVALESEYSESKDSWLYLLRDLKQRGLAAPQLVIGDGNPGLWAALGQVYPEAKEQRCWNHRIMNLVDRLPKRSQADGKQLLQEVAQAETREEAKKRRRAFQEWCQRQGHDKAAELIEDDWERMVAFYDFPKEHWTHLRTTNPIESPFAMLRLRTDAAKRYKRVDNALAVIWKMLLLAESRFRHLNAPELLNEVWNEMRFIDGIAADKTKKERIAA